MTSLLTKYRPQDLDEVLGQDAVVKSLRGAIKENRGRAYLFMGPSGTGKTTLARITANALGCKKEDLTEVDAATQTGIDDMREVASGLMYRPLGDGAVKAVIIDEAHALSKSAITSLLKILEEPPEWVYWFLCTTEANKIPEAIRTRCLRYDLKPVSRPVLIALLEIIAESEKLNVAPPVIQLCAYEANGSPRQAIANLAVCAECVDRKEAADLLMSAADNPQAIDLARALMTGRPFSDIQPILNGLKDTNAESVRHVIRAYATTVILGAKSDKQAGLATEVLDLFAQPFASYDGISPLVLACCKHTLG